jgi:multiple sugar transport system substrate-binding protein
LGAYACGVSRLRSLPRAEGRGRPPLPRGRIPSNLSEDRIERAFEAIAWMTSPEAMKANVRNGFPVAPRFGVSADPEAAATSPIISVVDRLAKRNLLKAWPRPPVPEYLSLEAILGEEIHRALRGEVSD